MEHGNDKHRMLIENLPDAFAYCQMVTDSGGEPVDYIFLDVNQAFEEMTGFSREQVIGKKATELHPRIENSSIGWIGTFGQVALTGESIRFEHYFELEGRWHEISAFSDEPGYFAVIFRDVTETKQENDYMQQNFTRFRSLVKNIQAGITVENDHRKIILTNQIFCDIFSLPLTPNELEGSDCSSAAENLKHMLADPERFPRRISELVTQKRPVIGEKLYFADGRIFERDYMPVYDEEQNFIGHMWQYRDITDRKQMEAVLKESEEKYRTLFDQNLLAIYLHDFEGNIFDVNNQACLLLGYTYEELLEMSVFDFIYTKESGRYLSKEKILHIWHQMDVGGRTNVEDVHQRKDGTIFYVEVSIGVISYNNKNIIMALVKDITERKQAEEKIKYMSFHDALTDLYNRYYLDKEMDRLDTERQLPISVIMIDLNGLKLVNDAYGHKTGDEMLKSAADIIKNSCRTEDIVGRWGGDEFVILLPQTPVEEVEKIHRRIKNNCRGVDVKGVPISLAVGSGTKNCSEKDLETVLKEAEDSMYKQKLTEQKSTRSSVLKALLKTLQAKSYETEEHTTRMVNMAWKIGEKIGLVDMELNRLNQVITHHDIGKIDIPETILSKEGPLTDEEWAIIKTHPEAGYRILRASEDFFHVSEEILAHHERWDGQGYSQGLKEKEIPLLARITSIVDAYDVMTRGRPYKKAMSREEIIAELKRCAGTQFDPELVEIFIEVLITEKE